MTIAIITAIITAIIIAAAIVVVALELHRAAPLATTEKVSRRELKVVRLLERLRTGDVILVTPKRGKALGNRLPKRTVFMGLTEDGDMICQTSPFGCQFRRSPQDLLRLSV